jgi:hypothetical protein
MLARKRWPATRLDIRVSRESEVPFRPQLAEQMVFLLAPASLAYLGSAVKFQPAACYPE